MRLGFKDFETLVVDHMRLAKKKIDIRGTEEEREQIKEMARIRGMTVSELVKTTLLGRKMVVRVKDNVIKPS